MYDREASNKELMELCEAVDAEVKAKNPKKPTKADLIAALDEYYGETAEVVDEDEVVSTPDVKPAKQTRAQKRKQQYLDNMKLVRVLITSNATNQTKQDVITVSWGNLLLGYNTDRIILGKPWHVRHGALNNLRGKTISTPIQNEEHNRIDYVNVPAYNIVDLGLLTMAEYREMGSKQKAKEASLAIL